MRIKMVSDVNFNCVIFFFSTLTVRAAWTSLTYEIVVLRHIVYTNNIEFLELELDALSRRICYTKIDTDMRLRVLYIGCVRY